MKIYIILFMAMMMAMATTVTAETFKNVDIEKLSSQARDEILKTVGSSSSSEVTPEKIREWGEIGHAIGIAFHEAAKALSQDVNEFAKTPVGKVTMVLVAWKILGRDFLRVIVSIPLYIFIMILLIWSYKRFLLPGKARDTEGKVQHIEKYKFNSSDARVGCAAVHVILFIITNIVFIGSIG